LPSVYGKLVLFILSTIWWQYTFAAIPHFWDDIMLFVTVVSQLCSSQVYQMQEPNLDIVFTAKGWMPTLKSHWEKQVNGAFIWSKCMMSCSLTFH